MADANWTAINYANQNKLSWTLVPGNIHNLYDPWRVVIGGPLPAGSGGSGGSGTSLPVATGVDPNEIANVLYGKVIPLSALGTDSSGGGLARIGTAGLIFGPYFSSNTASFAVSFGYPSNPAGTRRVYEVALDGKIVWELAAGSPAGALDPSGFIAEAFACRFYSGTFAQTADALEIIKFGSEAIAYRPQMMLWFDALPLAPFNNLVPFVSCKIGDVTGGAVAGDGVNLGDALESVAYSPWLEFNDTFEATGVADIVQGMILTEDQSFLGLLQNTSRVYRTLDILQTDKLRINDRGASLAPDLYLNRDRICEEGVQYSRQDEGSIPRELELLTIDPDADYMFVPSKASRPRDPVPVTSSVGKVTLTLPVIIGATTRASLVTYAKYQEAAAIKRVQLKTMLYGYELEPGDLIAINQLADGFDHNEVLKVIESTHGANFENELTLESILKCSFPTESSAEHLTCINISTALSTTKTFSSADFGAANANRVIAVALNINGFANTMQISGVTIGGVTATQAIQSPIDAAKIASGIFYASVPTGVAGDIVVTTTQTFTQATVHIYRFITSALTVVDTASDIEVTTNVSLNATVDVVDGGYVIAAAVTQFGANVAWVGANPDCEFANTVGVQGYRGSANVTPDAAGTASITADPLLGGLHLDNIAMSVASFSL